MLIGNLGTGKTTFVQGLAAIGIKEELDPTFKLVSEYEGKIIFYITSMPTD